MARAASSNPPLNVPIAGPGEGAERGVGAITPARAAGAEPARREGDRGERESGRGRKAFRYESRQVAHGVPPPRALWLPGLMLLAATAVLFYWTLGRMWLRWS